MTKFQEIHKRENFSKENNSIDLHSYNYKFQNLSQTNRTINLILEAITNFKILL